MRTVCVVEMPRDDVIDMIAVRYAFVAATRAVLVRCVVPRARMPAGARRRIFAACRNDVFVDVAFVRVVKVAVVEVIDVTLVADCRVSAVFLMCMLMLGMHGVR
jgi:hypothetical protein